MGRPFQSARRMVASAHTSGARPALDGGMAWFATVLQRPSRKIAPASAGRAFDGFRIKNCRHDPHPEHIISRHLTSLRSIPVSFSPSFGEQQLEPGG